LLELNLSKPDGVQGDLYSVFLARFKTHQTTNNTNDKNDML